MKQYRVGMIMRGKRTKCLIDCEYITVSTTRHTNHVRLSEKIHAMFLQHETAWIDVGRNGLTMSRGMLDIANRFMAAFGNFSVADFNALDTGRYELLRAYIMDGNLLVRSVDLPTYRHHGKSDSLNPRTFEGTLREHDRKIRMRDMKLPTRVTRVNPKRTFVVSDLHFDDPKIIKYCRDEFGSLGEMNETIIERWNGTVGKSDSVFFLGDMTGETGRRPIDYWLSFLNGRIIMLRGNHDTKVVTKVPAIKHPIIIDCHGTRIMLSHYPYRPVAWNGWIIHGHVHNAHVSKYPSLNAKGKTANVSVEMVNYAPVRLSDLLKKMAA